MLAQHICLPLMKSILQVVEKTKLEPKVSKEKLLESKVLWKRVQQGRCASQSEIGKIQKIDLDANWKYMVKPHNFYQLTKSINNIIVDEPLIVEAHMFNC